MKHGPTLRPRGREHDPLSEVDVILPRQFLHKRNEGAAAERHLLIALLDDAIHCFKKNLIPQNRHQHRLFEEAEEWIFGDAGGRPFSFESVCRILDLDPEYIRNGLRRWHDEELAKQRQPHTAVRRSASARSLRKSSSRRK